MAYGRRRIPRSKRLSQLKRETFVLRSGVIVLVSLVLLFGLIFLSRMEFFRIESITMEGNSVTSSDEIRRIIEDNIAGYYLGMFSQRNALLYPKGKIKNDLMNEFQRIKSLDLSVKDFSDLRIVVEERAPDILWCGLKRGLEAKTADSSSPNSIPDASSDVSREQCYFIDSNGLIYSKAPNFSGDVFLRVYGEIGDLEPVGQEFLPLSKYQSLKFIQNAVEQYGLTPVVVVRLKDDDIEMYFKGGGKFVYNSNQDMARLADDLGTILRDPEFRDGLESGELRLDYIDLRLGNKVYYRFK